MPRGGQPRWGHFSQQISWLALAGMDVYPPPHHRDEPVHLGLDEGRVVEFRCRRPGFATAADSFAWRTHNSLPGDINGLRHPVVKDEAEVPGNMAEQHVDGFSLDLQGISFGRPLQFPLALEKCLAQARDGGIGKRRPIGQNGGEQRIAYFDFSGGGLDGSLGRGRRQEPAEDFVPGQARLRGGCPAVDQVLEQMDGARGGVCVTPAAAPGVRLFEHLQLLEQMRKEWRYQNKPGVWDV